MRIDLLLGVLLVLGGIAVALYVRGGANVTPVSSVPGVAAADSVPQAPDSTSLLAGEVAVSFAVDDGNYPPSLGIGDEVRIIVTPSLDGAGEVRPLGEKTVVVSIDAPADAGAKRVITVRGPESIAAAIAGSGPIHVAILGGAAS